MFNEITGCSRVDAGRILDAAQDTFEIFNVYSDHNETLDGLVAIINSVNDIALKGELGELAESDIARLLPDEDHMSAVKAGLHDIHDLYGIDINCSGVYLRSVEDIFTAIQAYRDPIKPHSEAQICLPEGYTHPRT